MRFVACLALWCTAVSGVILDNGHPRQTNFLDTKIDPNSLKFQTYEANATEISYKGRWDSKKVSWWSAPGIRFGFTGQHVAVTFGYLTNDATLVAWRVAGLDWQHTNVTAGATHLLASPQTLLPNATKPGSPSTFEMRVTNYAWGVQLAQVHVAAGEKIVQVADRSRRIEFIGDSLSAGMYTSYEGLSSFAYGIGEGLGDTEYSITAYPGICAADQECWGNPRGQAHQWFYTSDTSWRAQQQWGENPEPWDFTNNAAADLVVINIGTNDNSGPNNVTKEAYVDALTKIIQGVHGKWPNAQVILMSLWLGFSQVGNTYEQDHGMDSEVHGVYEYFNSAAYLAAPTVYDGVTGETTSAPGPAQPFVHFFNTTGILQHNDIAPLWHPTDVGAIKVASHMIQYIRIKFDWELRATGPEVFHETLIWNDESGY